MLPGVQETVVLWEELRPKQTTKEQKAQLVAQIVKKVRSKLPHTPDSSTSILHTASLNHARLDDVAHVCDVLSTWSPRVVAFTLRVICCW